MSTAPLVTSPPVTSPPVTSFVIALDGTAASGKGTLARKVAAHYHLPHLDTGLTYRAVAHALLQRNIPLDEEDHCVALARDLDISQLDGRVLSHHAIGEAASKIAQFAVLRTILVEKQRHFAHFPPEGATGAVLDGRDIGSVVVPQAAVKFYVTASLEERAWRRYRDLCAMKEAGDTDGEEVDLATIQADLQARDMRDSNRKASPLKRPVDAHLLDTTKLSIEEAFAFCVEFIDKKWQTRHS